MKFRRFTRIEQEIESCAFLILSFPRCGRTWMKHLLGHYIEKKYNVPFTKWLDRPRAGIPRISFRHDFMSTTGHIPWDSYFEIQNNKQFIFTDSMKTSEIIYLFRDPLDVLFSYWPYLQSIPYKNFECPEHTDIIDFANNKNWGLDIIINFMNMQLNHYKENQNKKIIINYEKMKDSKEEWQRLITFIFGNFDENIFDYADQQTKFSKMQEKNNKNQPEKIRFYRRGGSNYIEELPLEQQQILKNWPGLDQIKKHIKDLS